MTILCNGICKTPTFTDKYVPSMVLSRDPKTASIQKKCRKCGYVVFDYNMPGQLRCPCCSTVFATKLRRKAKYRPEYNRIG